MTDHEEQTVTVTAEWLIEHSADANIVVLDASWHMPGSGRDAATEFARGHIPDARFFDIDTINDAGTDLPHMLPEADDFARMMSELGVSSQSQVIVYDTVGIFSAPRAWWMFRAMGHNKVAVLDGGLPAWRAHNGHVTDARTPLQPARFNAQKNTTLVASLEAVRIAGTTGIAVLDARPAARFKGQAPEPRPGLASGHMPGARNIPFAEVLTATGMLKPKAELEAIFGNVATLTPEKPVITTCGSGVTAAILSLALARIGHPDTALYDGSWAQWGSRADCPVEISH